MTTTVPLPTHAQGLTLFDEVIACLSGAGFTRLRVDTLQHPSDAVARDRQDRWTVRHHYTHGEWELYYEPDQITGSEVRGRQGGKTPDSPRAVRIRLDRPLPTPEAVISELFGPVCGRYFPAKPTEVPQQRRRPSRSLSRRVAAL